MFEQSRRSVAWSWTTRHRRWRRTAKRCKAYGAPGEEQVPLLEKMLRLQRIDGRERGRRPDLGAAHRPGQGSEGTRPAPARRRAADGRARRRARRRGRCWSRRSPRIRRTRLRWSRCASWPTGCPTASALADKLARALAGLPPPADADGRAQPSRASCGSVTASWPARRRPGHRHRGVRAGRRARSRPARRRARRWLRSTTIVPDHEDAADGESPPAAGGRRGAR